MSFEIGNLTIQIIRRLYVGNNMDRAVLASLRDAATLNSPKAQKIWPIMLPILNRKQLSRDGTPTPTEVAIFVALRLCAIQQQGRDTPVYNLEKSDASDSNMNFFNRLARIRANPDNQEALDRRFRTLTAATNIESAVHSLVSLVNIMKSKDKEVTINYPQLAEDLYWFQMSFEQANRIKLFWSEKYYQTKNELQNVEETTNND